MNKDIIKYRLEIRILEEYISMLEESQVESRYKMHINGESWTINEDILSNTYQMIDNLKEMIGGILDE